MHFYTYDEWKANSYYSEDSREISKGSAKIYTLDKKLSTEYLHIRSCWKHPKFISSQSENAVIRMDPLPVDCDIGCLYQLKDQNKYPEALFPDSTPEGFRKNRGCIQSLTSNYGDSNLNKFPFLHLQTEKYYDTEQQTTLTRPYVYYDAFQDTYKEILTVNLKQQNRIDRLLVFQSIYSGSIAFESMNSSIELYTSPYIADESQHQEYDYIVNTAQNSSDSLMLAVLLLTFDTVGETKYLVIENVSEFVYGHVDMDNRYNWNMLWQTYSPTISRPYLESSLMHFQKEYTP